MAGKEYREIRPGKKTVKGLIVRVMLFFLGRGFQSLAARDPDIRKEIDGWSEGFTIMFNIMPFGPFWSIQKRGGKLRYLGMIKTGADLQVDFKNLETAFLVLTGQMGTPQGYAEHRVSVKGDLVLAMSMIRCLDIVQFYLFPAIIAKRVVKRLPRMTFGKFGRRVFVYLVGIPLGI
ncbi:MAG: hypothetical protein ACOY31_01025 [Bacillota bacterium]